jgi:osmoprotectant transport system permease protein
VRTALILAVGTITLAALIGGVTLGVIINAGIRSFSTPVLVTGAVLTASLALLIDWAAGIAEIVLRPKGL